MAAVTRLNGRYAICSIAGVTLTLTSWECEIRTDYADGTAHGDFWDVPVPLKYSWTARASGYFDTASTTSGTYLHTFSGLDSTDQTAVAFVGYASADNTAPIFHGNGFITRARWESPQSQVIQEIEMRGTGAPTSIP